MGSFEWRKPLAFLGRVLLLLQTPSFKGTYHFTIREKVLRLVYDMPDSNRNWKGRYFFVKGTDWVYRQEEWEMMPHGYFDNTWAFVRDSGQSRKLLFLCFIVMLLTLSIPLDFS